MSFMGFKPSNKGRQEEDASGHMFDAAPTTAPGRQHSYNHPTQSQGTRDVDVHNPLPVGGTRLSAIELSPAPGCSLDVEDGRHHRDDAPSAPPLQQEKSWNSQQLSRSYDHSIPRAEDRDVTWALTNGQPLGQPAATTRNTHSSWRDTYLVPQGEPIHLPVWTVLFTALAVLLMAYMAAQHPLYIRSLPDQYNPTKDNPDLAADINAQAQWGPKSLGRWLNIWGAGSSQAYVFDAPYIITWGGRYNPKVADGEWWRWFSSLAVHASVSHVVSNMVLFVVLSMGLERQYGTLRILLVFLISGLGGNFTSAVFERSCTVVTGASGAVFGLLGLYCADVLLNCRNISAPLLRILLMIAAIAFVFVTDYLQTGPFQVSHFTHLGGFICGLFPSLLLLPSSRDTRWTPARSMLTTALRRSRILPPPNQAPRPLISRTVRCIYHPFTWYTLLTIGAAVLVLVFAGFPTLLYTSRFPNLSCPAIMP